MYKNVSIGHRFSLSADVDMKCIRTVWNDSAVLETHSWWVKKQNQTKKKKNKTKQKKKKPKKPLLGTEFHKHDTNVITNSIHIILIIYFEKASYGFHCRSIFFSIYSKKISIKTVFHTRDVVLEILKVASGLPFHHCNFCIVAIGNKNYGMKLGLF